MKSYTYIQAYFAQNLGDDLFVRTLVRRYPHECFYIMEPRKRLGDLAYEKNVMTLTFPMRIFLKVRSIMLGEKDTDNDYLCSRAKAAVRIGGSIFIEKQNWRECAIEIRNKNTYVIGANFGPYTSEEFLLYVILQLKQAKDCCLRDRYSYKLLSEKLSNVRYAPDVLFGYSYLPVKKGEDSIGISVIDFTNRDSVYQEKERYIDGIVQICRYYIEKKQKVVLFGFCKNEGDEYAIDEIIAILGVPSGIKKCIYSGNIDEFIHEIHKCKKLYATRFHAMIMGWIMKKDVVPIIYSNKQINVIKDIGYIGTQWDILHHQDFSVELLNNDDGHLPESTIKMLQIEADEQFAKLDEFYGNNTKKC